MSTTGYRKRNNAHKNPNYSQSPKIWKVRQNYSANVAWSSSTWWTMNMYDGAQGPPSRPPATTAMTIATGIQCIQEQVLPEKTNWWQWQMFARIARQIPKSPHTIEVRYASSFCVCVCVCCVWTQTTRKSSLSNGQFGHFHSFADGLFVERVSPSRSQTTPRKRDEPAFAECRNTQTSQIFFKVCSSVN